MDFKKILFKANDIDVEKALPDAVVFCNKDGKIQWVNDKSAQIFETSKMHLLTSNIADFIENAQNVISKAVITEGKVITKLITKEVYFDMTAKEIEEGFVLAFRTSENICVENKINQEDLKVDSSCILVGEKYRIQVLTERLILLLYALVINILYKSSNLSLFK